jgi:hypothetical protein
MSIYARSATVNVADKVIETHASGTSSTVKRPSVVGGRWIGPGGTAGSQGGTFAYLEDTGNALVRDVTVLNFGKAFYHRNYTCWSEDTLIDGANVLSCDRLAQFDPASVTGGAGTSSFSRTRYKNVFFSGGFGNCIYMSDNAGVYDSSFEIVGNLAAAVTDFVRLAGSIGGTTFDIRVEDTTNTAHNLFNGAATLSGKARLKPYPVLRNSIALLTGNTYDKVFDTTEYGPQSQTVTVPGGGSIELTSLADIRGAFIVFVQGTGGVQGYPMGMWAVMKANTADTPTIFPLGTPVLDSAGQTLSLSWGSNHRPALGLSGGTATSRQMTAWCMGIGQPTVSGWHTSNTKV